eukprot:1434283-Amphidinium_carterae.1
MSSLLVSPQTVRSAEHCRVPSLRYFVPVCRAPRVTGWRLIALLDWMRTGLQALLPLNSRTAT